MDDIKVSIVVCSYNQEKYIRQTLDSIISQEHPYTWELIVCDDASQDSTAEIIKEYADLHEEIIPVLRKENLGVVKNFFDGVSRCKSEYIMVCGGDDYFIPGKIKKQIGLLDSSPEIGLVHGDVKVIDKYGNYLYSKRSSSKTSFKDLIKSNSINASTITVRSTELSRYIREVNPICKNWIMEDKPLVIWFAIESKIKYIPGEVVAYRFLDNSLSHQTDIRKQLLFVNSAFEICKYYQNKYPNFVSYSFILNNHINNLLFRLNKADQQYKNYCLGFLEYNKSNHIKYYRIKKLRITSRKFDRIFRMYNKLLMYSKMIIIRILNYN